MKILAFMEILVPFILHYFDISLVEMIINGKFFYNVKSDFSSLLFFLSMSMIFQVYRKKKNQEIVKMMPLKLIAMVICSFI